MQVEQGVLGMQGGYVTYRVSASTALPGYAAPNVAVRRRFRDFVVRCLMGLLSRYCGLQRPITDADGRASACWPFSGSVIGSHPMWRQHFAGSLGDAYQGGEHFAYEVGAKCKHF